MLDLNSGFDTNGTAISQNFFGSCEKKTTARLLYLFEDSGSGYDIISTVMHLLFPNTNSCFYALGGIDILYKWMIGFLNGAQHLPFAADLGVKDFGCIILCRDNAVSSEFADQALKLASRQGIPVYSTMYYCFESCLFSYSTINDYTCISQKYSPIYILIKQYLQNFRNNVLDSNLVQDIMGSYLKIHPESQQSLEDIANTIYYQSYSKLPCIGFSKHGYKTLAEARNDTISKKSARHRYFNDLCVFTGEYDFCTSNRRSVDGGQARCSIPTHMKTAHLIDFYYNSELSAPLRCDNFDLPSKTLYDLEASYAKLNNKT